MLAQAAERVEFRTTSRERASEYLFLVPRAGEMAVEVVQRPETAVAEHTLVATDIGVP